jgi:hypothetical protein
MITKASHFLNRYATGWNVLIFFVLQMLFNLVVFPYFQAYGVDGKALQVLDLRFGFSPDDAYEIINSYGDEGRVKMLFIGQVIDSIYPLVYTLFDILAITFLFNKILPANSQLKSLNLFPVFAMVFDFLENHFVGKLITIYPEHNDGTVQLASTFNQLKWVCAAIGILLVVIGLIGWAMKSRQKTNPAA